MKWPWGSTAEARGSLSALWLWYLGNALALTFLVLIPVWIKVSRHGFHNFDLGIYAQALYLIRLGDLNPFLTVRNVPVFNDHCDPILILAAPLAKILEPAYAALVVEHVMVLLAPLPLIYLAWRDRRLTATVGMAITFLLFNRGVLSGLDFPTHASTWSVLPLTLLGVACLLERRALILAAAAFLFCFREEFPFVGVMLALFYLLTGKRNIAIPLLLLSVVWAWAALWLRPHLLGPTLGYGAMILTPFRAHPWGTILGLLGDVGHYRRFAQCLIPLLPPAWWLVRNRVRPNAALLPALLPLLAIRFLGDAWKFHYLAPVSACLLLALWPKDGQPLPLRVVVLTILFTLGTAVGPIQKDLAAYGPGPANAFWQGDPRRLAALAEARQTLLQDTRGKVLAEGNLVPLLARRPGIYQFGGPQDPLVHEYRFVLVEKPPAGDPWPLTYAQLAERLQRWRSSPGARLLRDDAQVFFAEGSFRY